MSQQKWEKKTDETTKQSRSRISVLIKMHMCHCIEQYEHFWSWAEWMQFPEL